MGARLPETAGTIFAPRRSHFEAKGSGFELEHFPQIQTARLSLAGQLDFQASGSGPVQAPTAQATLNVTKLVVTANWWSTNNSKAAWARPSTSTTTCSPTRWIRALTSRHCSFRVRPRWPPTYPTQARLTAENIHIGRLLRDFNVKDVSSESVITLQAAVNGPARLPKQMEGTLDINKFAISVGGIALRSEADLTAAARGGVLHLDPLRIDGDETNLQAEGSVAVLEQPRTLRLYAKGAVNLKLAQSFDPNITSSGHMDFSVGATGTIDQPNLTGQVRFADVAISLGDLPNGLSQMNGTLVFDQDRLTVQELTAVTGGGKLQLGGFDHLSAGPIRRSDCDRQGHSHPLSARRELDGRRQAAPAGDGDQPAAQRQRSADSLLNQPQPRPGVAEVLGERGGDRCPTRTRPRTTSDWMCISRRRPS